MGLSCRLQNHFFLHSCKLLRLWLTTGWDATPLKGFFLDVSISCHGNQIWRHKENVVKPLFNKNAYFLPFFGVKTYKTQPIAAKCLIVSYLTTLAKFFCNFRIFPINNRKTQGRDCNIPPPPPHHTRTPCTIVGVLVCVYVRGLITI